jgi:ABC-type antimicrobial peptide transport system permease subunit
MKISDLLKLSFDNLRRRKGRTALTVLGVVIGASAIILMVSIGVALDKSFDDMLRGMGDLTTVYVYNWDNENKDLKLNDAAIDSFALIDNVKVATPVYDPQFSISIVSGTNDKYVCAYAPLQAIRQEAMKDFGYELDAGEFPAEKGKTYLALAGQDFAYQFENTRKNPPHNRIDKVPDANGNYPDPFVNMLHDKFKIKAQGWMESGQAQEYVADIKFTGILKGNGANYQTIYGMVMSLDQVLEIEKEYNKINGIKDTSSSRNKERIYNRALVKATDIEYVDEIEETIKGMGYETDSMVSFRNEMKKQTKVIQLILGGLGGISLLVSAIGIANTMTMAIYERTKEIGVMKVLGCELKDIKNMFLAEAAGIGFIGGVVGVVFSYLLSFLMNFFVKKFYGPDITISIIPLWLAMFGMGFSLFVGLVSGYVPASKAVKVTALSAIRHE